MPYIVINTVRELDLEKKEKIKAALGRLMSIIPTKAEANLLIDFSGGHTFYKGGVQVEGAYIDLKLYGKSDFEPKKQYTAEVFSLLSQELGLTKEYMYLTIQEYETWGSNGELKTK